MPSKVREFIREHTEYAKLITGCDDAIIGASTDGRVVYDRTKLVEHFMNHDDMMLEEAEEWVSYNIERALPYFGVNAPIIVNMFEG